MGHHCLELDRELVKYIASGSKCEGNDESASLAVLCHRSDVCQHCLPAGMRSGASLNCSWAR